MAYRIELSSKTHGDVRWTRAVLLGSIRGVHSSAATTIVTKCHGIGKLQAGSRPKEHCPTRVCCGLGGEVIALKMP